MGMGWGWDGMVRVTPLAMSEIPGLWLMAGLVLVLVLVPAGPN